MARTLFSAKSTRVEALTVHFETAGLFTFAARPTLLSSFLGVEERGFFFLDGGLASIFETTKSLRNEKRRLAVKSHIVKVTHKQIVGYLALRQQTYGKMRKLPRAPGGVPVTPLPKPAGQPAMELTPRNSAMSQNQGNYICSRIRAYIIKNCCEELGGRGLNKSVYGWG